MSSKIYSVELAGLQGQLVEIEVDNRMSLPGFSIVGLPDTAVQEARERVISAVRNLKISLPRGKIVVNLAPADLRKVGTRYDVPIALGLISFSGLLPKDCFKHSVFLGELALDGSVRPVSGVLASTEFAMQKGFNKIYVPKDNAKEAALIEGIQAIPIGHIKEAILHLNGELNPLPVAALGAASAPVPMVDLSMIRGQTQAKRALEISAAGGHNLLLSGAPGAGKTLLAKALSGILPDMTRGEMLEVTKVYSAAGLLDGSSYLVGQRPFRPVHHTASATSIVGGGAVPQPGEMTLAHRGVLFMDEIAEFSPRVLEVLRQPMEDHFITITRARARVRYPCQFTLVAAMNPCPCGYYNVEKFAGRCDCPKWKILQYRRRLSGPLLDRIDIHLHVEPVETEQLSLEKNTAEDSATVKRRVQAAHRQQLVRYKHSSCTRNAELGPPLLEKFCALDQKTKNILQTMTAHYQLSARAYYKSLKLARTIADLESCDAIQSGHLVEAFQYLGGTVNEFKESKT